MPKQPIELHKIADDLSALKYPVQDLKFLPGNPRRGNVLSVMKSLTQYGQLKPVVAVREENGDCIVIAGNTTLRAASELGWTHVAVTWADLDEKNAVGFALADNRTHDLGEYDEENLANMLSEVKDDPDIFGSTGYDDDFLASILKEEDGPGIDLTGSDPTDDDDSHVEGGEPEEPKERAPSGPVIQYTIVFEDETQQQNWFTFVRWLKRTYTDVDSIAGRIDAFLKQAMPQEP